MTRIQHKKQKKSIVNTILTKKFFEVIIMLYTIIFTLTNLAGYTDINWIYIGLPFWIFIFGPAVYSFVIYKILFGGR